MKKQILDIFDYYFSDIVFNKEFYFKIKTFRTTWANKNIEHISFLGGNLIGVNRIIFSNRDFDMFFRDVCEIDSEELQKAVLADPNIMPNFIISSNVLNLTTMYIARRFLLSKHLDTQTRSDAAREAYLIFSYRALSSMLVHFFKYKLNNQTALLVYEKLSRKFLIKKKETWQEVLTYRSADLIDPKKLHYTTLMKFNGIGVTKILNDLHGRLKDMIKNIFLVVLEVSNSRLKVNSESGVISGLSGEEGLRELLVRSDRHINYIVRLLDDEGGLIKPEIVNIIYGIVPNMSTDNLDRVLVNIVETSGKDKEEIGKIVTSIATKSYQYLTSKSISPMEVRTLDKILLALRGMWISSRSNTPEVAAIKKKVDKLVIKHLGRKSKNDIIATRIGFLLYIYLRTVIGNKFSDGESI